MSTNSEKIPGKGMALVSTTWAALFCAYFATFVLGAILPDLRETFNFGLEVSGTLTSITFIVKLVIYIPFALWATRANPKYFLGLIFIAQGLGFLGTGFATSITMLYISRALLAIAGAGIAGPMSLVKANWIPKSRLGQINGLENAITNGGQLLATSFAVGLIALLGSWQTLLNLAGLVSVGLGILWFITFKENPAVGPIVAPEKKPFLEPLIKALKIPSIWLLGLGWPGTTLVWIAFLTFWPTYAVQSLGLDRSQAGFILGLIPIASIIASLTTPTLAKWIGYEKPLIWSWGFILPLAYYGGLITSNVPLLCVFFFIAGYGAYAFVPLAITYCYKLPGIEPATTGASISFILTLTSVGGTLAGTIVGSLGSSLGLDYALKICCLSPLIWGVLTFFLPELGRKAMEKARAKAETA